MSIEDAAKKAFASDIKGSNGDPVIPFRALLKNKSRAGTHSTSPIAKYYSFKDSDSPFSRLHHGMRAGFGLGLITSAVYCPFNYLVSPSPMATVISGVKIVGLAVAAGATHSSCVTVIADLRGVDDYRNHFLAGLASGAVLSWGKSPNAIFMSAMGVAIVTSFIKQSYVENWPFLIRAKTPTLTGVKNLQCYLTLNQKYMNPEYREQEEDMEKHI